MAELMQISVRTYTQLNPEHLGLPMDHRRAELV